MIATYLLIVAGAVVRVTGSGLGCPDWPTCHGRLIPPLEPAALIEYTHRLLGAIVSVLILAVPVAAWLWRRQRRILVPATLVPLLLAIQIPLGAAVVWLELPPMVVLVHLGFAMLILGGLTWVAAQAGPEVRVEAAPVAGGRHYRALVTATAVVVFVLVLTGAYTRASGASWACAGFPGCDVPGTAIQAAEAAGARGLVHIHLFHRSTAYLASVLVIASLAETWRLRRGVPALKRAASLLAVLLLAQISIGALAVSFGLPTALRG
ncbi:MAG: COX15/CtaA family protein, partial [Chloroflexota bacterium]